MERISQGVWLAWQLARKRTTAANKREISGVQMFCAILELAGRSPETRTRGLDEPKGMSAKLLDEELRRALAPVERRAIDLPKLREQLAREAGIGKVPLPRNDALNRSTALRTAFERATLFANDARRDGIELSDLAAALLEQPGALVRRALIEFGLDVDRVAIETRLGGAIDGATDELS